MKVSTLTAAVIDALVLRCVTSVYVSIIRVLFTIIIGNRSINHNGNKVTELGNVISK